ncbi:MAG: hypothetical protein JWQ62_500 [Lacunisphaera sp.]|nr:hypothetical protein [Lacunisphaera sp.]
MSQVRYFGIITLALGLGGLAHADDSRRLFDFTAVSAANPVVATIDGTIVIPLSELRGYRDSERLQAITDPASLSQKRAVLEDLINEYLYVDDACRSGVLQSEGFQRQMEATRTMLLTDFLASRVANEQGSSSATDLDPGAALADRLFEAAAIEVSNEAYALLKRAAQAVVAAGSGEENSARLHGIIAATPDATLVRYEDKSISVRQILAIFAGLPAPRPAVETPAGLTAMIKPLIAPELMASVAVKRGIAADPEFQHKFIQNRNALLRFHVQGLVDRQANELMHAPDFEAQLHAWYDAHQADYAVTTGRGEKLVPSYDQARPRVEGDYSVALRERLLAAKAQALRRAHAVHIDEAVLRGL